MGVGSISPPLVKEGLKGADKLPPPLNVYSRLQFISVLITVPFETVTFGADRQKQFYLYHLP